MIKPCVEICVTSTTSAVAAQSGGADRVELCAEIALGGTTPSAGAIDATVRSLAIPVSILVRPRAGNFIYTDLEHKIMLHDIDAAKDRGARGIVIGMLNPDAVIDRERTAALVAAARPLETTFHKAFDLVRDPIEALETLIEIGLNRVLTSGCADRAIEGVDRLASLVKAARGRIEIMAGGAIRLDEIREIINLANIDAIHLGSAAAIDEPIGDNFIRTTDARKTRAIVAAAKLPAK